VALTLHRLSRSPLSAQFEDVYGAYLRDDSAAVRWQAVRALGQLGHFDASARLLSRWSECQPPRCGALLAAREFSVAARDSELQVLTERLRSGESSRWQPWWQAVVPAPGGVALALAQVDAANVTGRAAMALGSMAAPEAIPLLTRLARDRRAEVRAAAALALVGRSESGASTLLSELAGDPIAEVSVAALHSLALGAAPNAPSVEQVVCAASSSRHPFLRLNAVLGRERRGLRCGPGLAEILTSDASADVRAVAARLLRERGGGEPADARALLRCRLRERDRGVRSLCRGEASDEEPRVAPWDDWQAEADASGAWAIQTKSGTVLSGFGDQVRVAAGEGRRLPAPSSLWGAR